MNNNVKRIWYRIKQYPLIGVPYQKLIGNRKTEKLFQQKSRQVKAFGKDAVALIEKALPELGVLYYIDFGSLLGVIRDHQFIDWDPDIDYALVITEKFDWSKLQKVMNTVGFTKIKEWRLEGKITEQTYMINELTVDFFGHYRSDDKMTAYVYSRIKGHIYKDGEYGVYSVITPSVSETKMDNIEDIWVNVPVNAEQYLVSLYNDDWDIPNPKWVAFSGPAYHFIDGKVGSPTDFE